MYFFFPLGEANRTQSEKKMVTWMQVARMWVDKSACPVTHLATQCGSL